MSTEHSVSIKLLGKNYQIKCEPKEIASLHAAASHLDQKLQELRNSGKSLNGEQLALIAALNITHEMQLLKDQESAYITSMSERIQNLHHKIEQVVADESA